MPDHTDTASPRRAEPALAEKVAFLTRGESYPDVTRQVTVIETHFAYVFLTDRLAYKLKKPRRYPLVDLSSTESRRQAVEEEIRLNSELAPGVYLGLSMLNVDRESRLNLDGSGNPVDFLVRMRRLDQADCLQEQLAGIGPDVSDLELAAGRLARYYLSRQRETPIGTDARRQRWQHLCDELGQLMGEPGIADLLHSRLLTWLEHHTALLETRRAVDAHGDLRPEHIYLGANPVFIDRLEFNPRLRLLDPVEELAFLTMECDRLGGRWVGERFLAHYRKASGDTVPASLFAFYEAGRSLLWAVLSARHLVTGMGNAMDWKHRTRFYLHHGMTRLGGAPP